MVGMLGSGTNFGTQHLPLHLVSSWLSDLCLKLC
jgi:hypothetical protein